MSANLAPLPTSVLGATGCTVTRAGLGGEGILRTRNQGKAAQAVLQAAVDAGITYFDTARLYDDAERYHGKFWGAHEALREQVFLVGQSAERHGGGARRQLEESLDRLDTDYLDLWLVHDLRTDEELEEMLHPGGALDTFIRAKELGMVRHLGVAGQRNPCVLRRALELLPVEVVMLPVNPLEAALGGFLTEVLPLARAKGMGVVGMKVLGGAGGYGGAGDGRLVQAGLAADALLRWAFAQDVDAVIAGCATPAEVWAMATAVQTPMGDEEARALVEAVRPRAGQLATWRGDFASPC